MNDFTKAELKELHYVLAHYSNHHFTKPENVELEGKIKTMIGNYCDHNSRESYCDENGQLGVRCADCKLPTWHEKD